MADGIPYLEVPNIIARHGGEIRVNPLSQWGSSRLWTACKRARKNGLVEIKRISCSVAVVTARTALGERE